MSHTIKHLKQSRWKIAVAAVGIHMSIGSVYAYSVWKIPLTATTGWSDAQVAMGFSLAILCLGITAAVSGRMIDRGHPRSICLLAAFLFGGGLLLSGISARTGFLPGFYLGYGGIGGIGLGIGYVAPVSTLLKWFPDRRGLAAGLATMGFGFGAMLAGPLISRLTPDMGVTGTFLILGTGYFTVMSLSALWMKPAPENWAERFTGTAHPNPALAPTEFAVQTPLPGKLMRSQPYILLWLMFFLNILCGIALISIASPMAMEVTGMSPKAAATMVGAMGLFNGLGRIGWSAASDRIGRPATWACFFFLQIVAFGLLPGLQHPWAFQLSVFVILSCYGGGFATAPAFLGDLFGTRHLSALYGVLLTAWASAGLLGPLLVAWIRGRSGAFEQISVLFMLFLLAGLMALWGVKAWQRRSSENF